IRHIFHKRGGSLGESGCVAWMFDRIGVIEVPRQRYAGSLDDLILAALEAGADDVREEEETYTVVTSPERLREVRDALEAQGVPYDAAELTYQPKSTVELTGDALDQVLDLIEALQAHDDVQEVYANVSAEEASSEAAL
ncbi:MAG: YebC/PmpR family DNA-binding transcriptional regulator, partial [Alicyclobacillus sp.]|nr:YebC/PmpR family DNA-binding transcriptional regulator [Alicyclobacillus sp.]